ncbi:SusD/RagB family nutrient-binding outer membrane lipoprotein [Puteibacter caeruleilacunae]|nr:SusD/RagB family nutrient-binding outer membrane lipoprotein [Puteibacter caeruleilacunae]
MKIKILLAVIIVFNLVGCETDSLDEFGKPYNSLTNPNVFHILSSGIRDMNSDDFQYWIHHMARHNTDRDLYDDFKSAYPWEPSYLQNKNLLDVIQRTEGSDIPAEKKALALAHVVRSLMFIRLTDSYGDIPYSEAGVETEDGVLEFPKYDSQEAIYNDCFSNLTKAIELIGDEDIILLGEADYVYHQNLQNWKLLANTIRLRMALRVTNVDSNLANKWFEEVAKYPVINSLDESATYERFDVEGFRNPLWNPQPNVHRMSKLFVDYLMNNNDPRLEKLVKPNEDGDYVGMENGLDYVPNQNYFSDLGAELTRADRESPILLFDEVCFIKAEMYLRGLGVTKDAQKANEWYQKGIRANMEFYNVSEADIAHFITNEPEATLTGDEANKRRQIGSQKWVGGIYNGFELFADMRRSGYPVIADRVAGSDPIVSLGETDGKMPRRLKYPDNELQYNNENYLKAIAATNNNSFLYRVWWDVE